jgi:hypothetical protein
MSAHRKSIISALFLSLAVSATAPAANLYWQGGTADLSSANYYNGSATVAPGASDILFIGDNGLATGTGTLTVSKIYIGNIDPGGGTQGPAGPGTVSLTSGVFTASSGTSPTVNFGTIIGYQSTGSLSISGAGTTYTSNGTAVGFGDDPSLSATLNISNQASYQSTNGKNMNIGDSVIGGTTGIGIAGHVNVDLAPTSTVSFKVASTLQVGVYASNSSYAQTGGNATADSVQVGLNGADNCSFSISGGTFVATSKAAAIFNSASSTTATSDGTTISFSGASTSTFMGFTLAGGQATNTTMTIADTATLNVTSGNFFVGRANSANTILNVNGGALNVSNNFLLGTSTSATGIIVNQAAGTVSTTTPVNTTTGAAYNFAVADTGTGDSTYNLSGTGTINTVAAGVIGRQNGLGVMNQLGGTANFNGSLHLGDQQPGTGNTPNPLVNATGTYNLSAGALNVTVPSASTTEAFSIAPSGTGTFRVIGGDATMNVTGNMGVYANTSGTNTGTLVFQPQPNKPLTTINVTGTATFNAGSSLQLDISSTKPTQGLFTVLNAASIVNSGWALSIPAGWNDQIVSGGNGQLLQFFAGDLNGDGRVNADDYAIMDRGAAKQLTDGADGDLNADGVINSQDYLLIDSAYAQLGGSLSPAFLAIRESEFGDAYVTTLLASVPEPTSLLACGIALLPLTRRRR